MRKKDGSPITNVGDDGKEGMGVTEKRRGMPDEGWWKGEGDKFLIKIVGDDTVMGVRRLRRW